MMRTLGQKRSAYALEEVLATGCKKPQEFKAFCAGAPAVILQNGLGQAFAFWLSKGKGDPADKHQALLEIIMKWLCMNQDDIRNAFITPCRTPGEMVRALSDMNQHDYLAAQDETLALLEWVKRYAKAFV